MIVWYYFACFGSVEDRTGKPISEQMMRQQGSKSDAMELERLEAEAAKRNEGILDGVQGILDVAGMVPAVGEIADGINALIYFARGDNVNGFISLAAMIPVVGQVATTAKLATKGGKFLKAANEGRKLWKLTDAGATAIKNHGTWGKLYKGSDGLWWSEDITKHGASQFKVFEETNKGLEWTHNADKYGDFIQNQHKSPTGNFIPWNQLKSIK